jgi:membrane protein YdbS with pleckstrin-like domain
MYWIFKFYKKVSWQRYNYSAISLIIIGTIAGVPTYNFSGSNMWNFLPLIHLAVTFVLLIIWSVIIVPIFILYHRTKEKDKLNNINLLNNVDINNHNNYSDNINQLTSNKNINLVISIFLILFLLFIFNLLFSVLWGETLWNFIVNGINFIWSWIFVYSR